jgi:sugar (pentulose or hexulose) kinase
MSESGDPRIVLRDLVGVADRVIEHPGQPPEYVDEQGNWAHTDPAANWRRVDDANLRIYDLVEPTTG